MCAELKICHWCLFSNAKDAVFAAFGELLRIGEDDDKYKVIFPQKEY